jgi:hypothetical protein
MRKKEEQTMKKQTVRTLFYGNDEDKRRETLARARAMTKAAQNAMVESVRAAIDPEDPLEERAEIDAAMIADEEYARNEEVFIRNEDAEEQVRLLREAHKRQSAELRERHKREITLLKEKHEAELFEAEDKINYADLDCAAGRRMETWIGTVASCLWSIERVKGGE